MNIFEKTPFGSGFERYEKGKQFPEKNKFAEYEKERGEDAGHFNYLREKLRKMKEGGSDIHFGQIDVDGLSDEAVNFYRLFEKSNLNEKQLDEYTSQFSPGDNEYNFAALLRNWILERKNLDVEKEKTLLKKEAEKKLGELKNKKPHIAASIDNIDLNLLRRLDFKIIADLDAGKFNDYENNLREYFRNKTQKNPDERLTVIENDPRFKCYCALKEALDLGPCSPEEFIKP